MSRPFETISLHLGHYALHYGAFQWNAMHDGLEAGLEARDRPNIPQGGVLSSRRPAVRNLPWEDDIPFLAKHFETLPPASSGATKSDVKALYAPRAVLFGHMEDLGDACDHPAQRPIKNKNVALQAAQQIDPTSNAPVDAQNEPGTETPAPIPTKRSVFTDRWAAPVKSWGKTFVRCTSSQEGMAWGSTSTGLEDSLDETIRHRLDRCGLLEAFNVSLDTGPAQWTHMFLRGGILEYINDQAPKTPLQVTFLDISSEALPSSMSQIESDAMTALLLGNLSESRRHIARIASLDSPSIAHETDRFSTAHGAVNDSHIDPMHAFRSINDSTSDPSLALIELLALGEVSHARAMARHGGLREWRSQAMPNFASIMSTSVALTPTDIPQYSMGAFGGPRARNSILTRIEKLGSSSLWNFGSTDANSQSNLPLTTLYDSYAACGLTESSAMDLLTGIDSDLKAIALTRSIRSSSSLPILLNARHSILQTLLPSSINPLGQWEVGDSDYGPRSSLDDVEMIGVLSRQRAVIAGSPSEGGNAQRLRALRRIRENLSSVLNQSRLRGVLSRIDVEHDEAAESLTQLDEYFAEDLD